jgi:HAD superfamily hydrolase (TIGR01484 family)
MSLPKVVAFDLDQTLTESKAPLTPSMALLLEKLLARTKVAVASGGKFEIFKAHVAGLLPATANLGNLYALPTSGAAFYEYKNGEWTSVYQVVIPEEDAKNIMETMDRIAHESGTIDYTQPSWGERIEYRMSQVTLSALGQEAPIPEKLAWDPTMEKRVKLRNLIAAALPTYDVKRGGATSIDVTVHGVNKAYGMRKLSEYLSIPIADMIYVGDALFPGGNDEVVKETGIRTVQVAGPEETAQVIEGLLEA